MHQLENRDLSRTKEVRNTDIERIHPVIPNQCIYHIFKINFASFIGSGLLLVVFKCSSSALGYEQCTKNGSIIVSRVRHNSPIVMHRV